MTTPFHEGYYLRGEGSNYTDYRWLPELTVPACFKIAEYLGMQWGESVLDVGAALGFYVKAFRKLGYRAYGYDVSQWAIDNCDIEVKDWMSAELPDRAFDWVTMKDVLEHIPKPELTWMLGHLNKTISKGMFIIVPLCAETGGGYIRAEDEADTTHVIRWTFEDWMTFLEGTAPGFNVNGSFHVHGIKPASAKTRHSCGFFTLTRP